MLGRVGSDYRTLRGQSSTSSLSRLMAKTTNVHQSIIIQSVDSAVDLPFMCAALDHARNQTSENVASFLDCLLHSTNPENKEPKPTKR